MTTTTGDGVTGVAIELNERVRVVADGSYGWALQDQRRGIGRWEPCAYHHSLEALIRLCLLQRRPHLLLEPGVYTPESFLAALDQVTVKVVERVKRPRAMHAEPETTETA